jgi:hypothetical protein
MQKAETFLGHTQTVQYAQAYADRANAIAQVEADQNKMLFDSCTKMARDLIVLQFQLDEALTEIERLKSGTENKRETCDENSYNLPNLTAPRLNGHPKSLAGSSLKSSTVQDAFGTAGLPEA